MASGSVYAVIRTYVDANWSACPVIWENEPGNPPAAGVWIYLELSGSLYSQQSLGAADNNDDLNRWDEEGIVYAHFHMPKNGGTMTARNFMKSFADLFRGTVLDSGKVEFMDISIGLGRVGDDEGRWFQIPVTIDWRKIDA